MRTVTGFLFVRHATADHVGRTLAGRAPGLGLSGEGIAQAERLGAQLASAPVAAVYSSPQERARETAEAIATVRGLEVRTHAGFQEVDFGDWTGRTIASLGDDAAWRWWNESRSTAATPGGEAMADVVQRALAGIRELAGVHPEQWVVVVSHCDVIRPLLAHFLGMPLDHLLRLDVDPASVSVVSLHPWGPRIHCVNRCDGAPEAWEVTP